MNWWRYSVSLIITAVFAAGCDRSAGSGTAKPQVASTPPAEVRIGYFANVTHAQAVLGVSSGDFASAVATSTIKTKVFNAGPSLIEALFANEIDIGYVGPGPTLSANQKSHGQGIRVVAGAAANGVLIVASKNSGINSLADLKGKRLATPQQGNTQDISARHYLVAELKQSDTNNILPVANAEQSAMMDRGQIDASWAPEPWGSRLVAETGAKVIAEEKDLWPDKQFSLTVVVTTPEFLAKHHDVVEKVLAVHSSWTQRLQQEPAKYADDLDKALTNLTGKKLPAGLVGEALGRVKFTTDPLESTFKTMGDWAHDLGFAQNAPDLSKLFDTSALKK